MRDGVHIRLTLTRGVKVTSGMDPRLNQSGPTRSCSPARGLGHGHDGLADHDGVRRFRRLPDPKIITQPAVRSSQIRPIRQVLTMLMLDVRFVPRRARRTCSSSRTTSCARAHGMPGGITRDDARALRCAPDAYGSATCRCQIYRADEMFCTGTMGDLRRSRRSQARSGRPSRTHDQATPERVHELTTTRRHESSTRIACERDDPSHETITTIRRIINRNRCGRGHRHGTRRDGGRIARA